MAIRKVLLPIKGYSSLYQAEDQPALTTPHLMNVRIPDTAEKQLRISKRPGFRKWCPNVLSANSSPVVDMCTVTVAV